MLFIYLVYSRDSYFYYQRFSICFPFAGAARSGLVGVHVALHSLLQARYSLRAFNVGQLFNAPPISEPHRLHILVNMMKNEAAVLYLLRLVCYFQFHKGQNVQ